MTYLERISELRIQATRKSMLYRDGKAWDNRKIKIKKRHCPRGKCFEELDMKSFKSGLETIKANSEDLLNLLQSYR